jgi:hypothetical protein
MQIEMAENGAEARLPAHRWISDLCKVDSGMKRCLKYIGFIMPWFVLSACWQLPDNFSSLPLDGKVQAYATRFKRGGAPNSRAEDLIARHGYAAAEAMVPYILGKRGIPPFIAIKIVWDVEWRGCNLRGSAAEEALKSLEKHHPQADEQTAAEAALEAIHSGRHSAPASEQLPVEVCRPLGASRKSNP